MLVRHGLAKKSLEAVNRWAERLYRVSPQALRHDVAVWLTRIDLGGPSGYAPVAGVCEPSRSCTLNRDEGLTSSFIIAHEMAHVLGLSHDGDPVAANDCEDEGYQGSVMAPLVAATFSRFHWSKCSKTEYHTKAHDWSCLLNKPQWKNATTVLSTIKYQYSLDDQCRMEFGEGYGLCSSFGATDPCTHLWCSNSSSPHHCKTKKGPPLEGTTCGEQKWCRHGFCVAVSQETEDTDGESPVRHNPQDGGWSTWSQWGPCSRTCGTGVAFRTRACDHPPPAWGGRRCRGKREEWKVCGVEECPLPRIDIRAQQCSFITRIVNLDLRRSALSWLPYEPKRRKKKCRISCYSHATNEVYIGREYVVDGTPCSYDQPNDICVQGKCVAMGCDKVVASMAQEDECGVCGGDGATCINNQFDYHEVPPTVLHAWKPLFTNSEISWVEQTEASVKRQSVAATLMDMVEAARSVPAPGFSDVQVEDLQEIVCQHQQQPTIEEMLEEDEEQQPTQEDDVKPGEPTTHLLTEFLTTIARLGEQLEEYDTRPHPRNLMCPALKKVMEVMLVRRPLLLEYSLVATLPAGARNIMIKEEAPTMNFLALTDNSSSFFLNGGRSQEPSKSFISEGAKFLYSSRGEREVLQARGPLLRPVSIMIHGTRAQESVRVTTTFLTQLKQEHYQWEVGPFTACSVTCGGGEQHQTLVCRDRRTDKQVFHSSCRHLPRPSLNTTTCNSFGCKAKWVTGPWEHCSTTCGPHGVQERTVSCVTLPEADGTNRTTGIVDPLRCSTDPMPEAQRECLRDPCPAHWSPSGWGECSSSCGEGVETRLWECVGGGGNEVTYNCGPQPRQVRVCIKAPCPPAPCLRDSSAFCQLPVLHRYCQVPKYRELCCHTCANIMDGLCVRWMTCVSDGWPVCQMDGLCVRWMACVSDGWPVCQMDDLCVRWMACVSDGWP
ncbi:A disintegrin and metalloproteinase with thrombospondin motifs 14-like 2, partial [Homarus americanus]